MKCRKKGWFRAKTEKVNTTTEFWIFELLWVPNFSLNWQFRYFGPNLPKKSVSGIKRKFPVENEKIALVHASMVVTYYIKLFRTGVDRRNGILMSLLLLVAETIRKFLNIKSRYLLPHNYSRKIISHENSADM